MQFDKKILLGGIHLSSELTLHEESSRAGLARDIMKEVNKIENDLGHSNTILIGDFNMAPFELGMVEYSAFNAVMSIDIAEKKYRHVNGSGIGTHDKYHYFYNPMWSFMGDLSKYAPGTYYWYDNSRNNKFRWNTLDQVLMRPCLIPNFAKESIKIIDSDLSGKMLINSKLSSRPKSQISDHLPIFLTIDLTK